MSTAIAVAILALFGGLFAAKRFGAQKTFQEYGGAVIGGLFATFTVGYSIFFVSHADIDLHLRLEFAEDQVLRILAEKQADQVCCWSNSVHSRSV